MPRTRRVTKRKTYKIIKKGKYNIYKSPKIFQFKRTMSLTQIEVRNYGQMANQALNIKLSNLPNYTEFTNLFDLYRICAVKINWVFSANTNDVTATPTVGLPTLFSVIDTNDDVNLSGLNAYLEYETCRMQRMDKPVKRYIKPKTATALYQGGFFTGYGSQVKNPWVDTTSYDTNYYGLKWGYLPAILGDGNTIIGYLNTYVTYYIQMRNVK